MTIIGRIRAQFGQRPAQPALSCEGRSLTYAQLAGTASALAARLRAHGVHAGDRVVLVGGRSERTIIAEVACLLIGATFVPVDAEQPQQRLRDLTVRARAAAVVDCDDDLPGDLAPDVAQVDMAGLGEAPLPEEPEIEPEHPLYLLYTSGTSGQPKAVVVPDRGLSNLISGFIAPTFDEHAVGTAALLAPFYFDASIKIIYGALATGRTLHIVTADERDDIRTLAATLTTAGVDAIDGTPSYLQALAAQLDDGHALALRCMLIGGEPLAAELADTLAAATGAAVYNVYGPTEATVDATAHRHEPGSGRVPIGRPIPGVEVRIMRRGRRVAPGQPGEIVIGGPGVALGYFDDAEMTAEKFRLDSFGPGSGRCYWTGDLGRQLRDGTIDYLGRIDEQLKIRGHRIEPGEIEQVAGTLPGIDAVAVVTHEQHGTQLVAFCTADDSFSEEALLDHLRARLPEYMVPSRAIRVESLPLNANGKLDRRDLAQRELGPRSGDDVAGAEALAPRTEAEQALAAAVQRVLRRDSQTPVDMRSSLFMIGGDSITAILLVAELARAGYRVTTRAIMRAASLQALAGDLEAAGEQAAAPVDAAGAVDATPIISDFFSRGYPTPQHYHQSKLLTLSAAEQDRVPEALTSLLRRHRVLAAAVVNSKLVLPAAERLPQVPVQQWDLSALDPAAAEAEAAVRATRLMADHDLARGPQLQAALITTSGAVKLLVAIHHIAVDALSWHTIETDLRQALAGAPAGEESPSLSFRAWAHRLAGFADSAAAAADRPHWQQTLAAIEDIDVPGVLAAATGTTTAATGVTEATGTTARAGQVRHRIRIPEHDLGGLFEPGPEHRARGDEILLAAVTTAAADVWPLTELPLLVETHGRPEAVPALADCEVSGTVGWFTTAYPVVCAVGQGRTHLRGIRNALRRVPSEGLTAGLLFPDRYRSGALALVNYLGRMSGASPLNPLGAATAKENLEPQPLTIDAMVSGGDLVVDLTVRTDRIGQAERERFSSALEHALRQLGAERGAAQHLDPVPADLGTDVLTVAEFDTLPTDAVEVLPLTLLQKGLLYEHLASAEDASREHFVQVSYRLQAPFSADKITQTAAELMRQVPALRSTIHWQGLSEPHQVVHAAAAAPAPVLRIHDLRGLSAAAQQQRIDALSAAARSTPFVLEEPGLFATDAVALADDDMQLIFTHHHIILDGWSLAELVRRFAVIFHGDGAVLDPVPSTAPYLRWLRSRDAEAFDRTWSEVMDPQPPDTRVETARSLESRRHTPITGSATTSAAQAQRPLRLEHRTSGSLGMRVQQTFAPHSLSTATAVEAALAVVLARLGGRDDVVYGVVVSGRDAPVDRLEHMMGLFINTIPRRVHAGADTSGAELAGSIREQALATADHAYGSLAAIQAAAGDVAFDCLFTFENYHADTSGISGAHLQLLGAVEQTVYPLTVTAEVSGDELLFTAICDRQHLTEADGRRILRRLETVLDSLAADLDAPLASVPSLDAGEPAFVTASHNPAAVQAADGALGEQLLRAGTEHAARPALIAGDTALTYTDLLAGAAGLAEALETGGVAAGDAVAVIGDRTPETIAALLGITLAGAAYVPVDVSTPAGRMHTILADSGAQVVVAAAPGSAAHPGLADIGCTVLAPPDLAAGASVPAELRARGGDRGGEDLAYLMYTSGSTGVPKGVMVPQRAVLRLARGGRPLSFGPGSVVLMTSSVAFDAATLEIWSTLLNGGTLVLAELDELLDPQALRRLITAHGVTVMWLTVSLFNQIAAADPGALDGLERLFIGGERVSADHVARLYAHNPDVEIVNGYGPTENTTFTTVYPIPRSVRAGDQVPIGRPIPGTGVVVRSSTGRICGVGETGELCAYGAGVALGYLGDPEATARSFIPGPADFGTLYRTGDLVRWCDEGVLEYLGRIDADGQVKIRGFRVEIGEVEAQLRALLPVTDVVVRPHCEANLTTSLIGYLAAAQPLDLAAVRATLAEHLPDYLVPVHLVQIAAVPLTPNGKLDERALPAPEAPAAVPAVPQTDIDDPHLDAALEAFAAGVGRAMGADENFFEAGGDSIKAIRVVSVLRSHGFAIGVSAVMRGMTPRRVAAELERTDSARHTVAQHSAEQSEVTGPVPATPIVTEFFDWDLQAPDWFNQDLVIDVTGAAEADIRQAVEALWDHHDGLRAVVRDGSLLLRPRTADFPFETLDVPAAEADAQLQAAASKLHAALSLKHGPLFAALLVTEPERSRLVLIAHHLIVDVVSWHILTDDLLIALHALQAGQPIELPAKTADLRTWAAALQAHGAQLPASQRQWWEDLDAAAAAAPPAFTPAAEGTDTAAQRHTSVLPAEAARAVSQAAAAAYGASAEDVLLAALLRALRTVLGQDQAALRLERHGRIDNPGLPPVERTVGWFTAMHPLVLRAQTDAQAAIVDVKDTVRAVPEDGLGYGLLPGGFGRIRTPLSFNYLGDQGAEQAGGFGQSVFNTAGASVAAANTFMAGVRVSAMIRAGRLHLAIDHDPAIAAPEQIAAVLEQWAEQISVLAEHCTEQAGSRFLTRADLPHAQQLSLRDLIRLHELQPAIEDVSDLSPLQEGMLVHSLDGGSEYVVQQVYAVHEPLRAALSAHVVETAAAALAAEHTALRTAFLTEGLSHPLAVVLADRSIPVAEDDLTGDDDPRLVDRAATAEVARGFDVAGEPLMRIRLVHTGTAGQPRMHLVLTMHHLVVDGWSVNNLMAQFAQLCRRLHEGAAPQELLAEARARRQQTAQHRDHIAWIQERDDAEFEHYWAQLLDGYETRAAFTSAVALRPDPAVESDSTDPAVESDSTGPAAAAESTDTAETGVDAQGIGRCEHRTSGQLAARLGEAHFTAGVTLSHLVHAAFGIVLAHETGSDDIVFGSIVSGRDHGQAGIDDAVGLFINTVPVRVRLRADQTAAQLAADLRDQALETSDFAYGSLRTVQDSAGVQGAVQCLLAFENYHGGAAAQDAGLQFESGREETNYPVSVAVSPAGSELAFTVIYDSAELTRADAERIIERMVLVLEQLADSPAAPVGQLQTLTSAQQLELSRDFNTTALAYDRNETVIEVFARSAAAHPQRPAVIFQEHTYSYGQLAAAVQAIAVQVAARVPRGGRVGVLTDRSPHTFAAMLGIMTAGCAYVPLDADSPQSRLAVIAEDAQLELVLTHGSAAEAAAAGLSTATGVPGLSVTASFAAAVDSSTGAAAITGATASADGAASAGGALDPGRAPTPADIAYCIYTSGSTGVPKGVELTHRGLANLRAHLIAEYQPSEHDRVLQFANTIFDASVWEMTLSLFTGAALVIVPAEMIMEPAALEAEMARTGVSLGLLPPQYYLQLDAVPMRIVTTGGGASSWAVLDKARRSGAGYVNAFGPSETTVLAATWCDADPQAQPASRVPIGRPVANMQATVVAETGGHPRLCGIGQVGELWMSGDGLAGGYLRLPEQTAEAFVDNPFTGTRSYRTGDRVRWLADGSLDFLGRMAESSQVKVRGYRIELAEVEAGLRQVARVRDAAVLAYADDDDTTALAAYIVADEPRASAEVQLELAELLPGYMIPAYIVQVPELPLNRSGKLDPAALPDPKDTSGADAAGSAEVLAGEPTAPQQAVAAAFAQALGYEQVQLDDNFFVIGGDSLKAIRVVSALRAQGYTVATVDVMAAMTPRLIGQRLGTADDADLFQQEVTGAVAPTAMTEEFFGWQLAAPHHFNQDLLIEISTNPAAHLRAEQAQQALDALWTHHDALRSVVADGSLIIRSAAEAGPCPLMSVSARDSDLEETIAVTAEQVQRSLDLEQGPLLRAVLFTAPSSQRILLIIHHLVVDIVSWQILEEDLRAAIDQVRAGRTPALPAKSASVQYWAQALRTHTKALADQQRAYWHEVAADLAATDLQVPAAAAGVGEFPGGITRFALSAEDTRALADDGTAAYSCTVEDLVLAALAETAHHVTGQARLSVRMESHGRLEHDELPPVDRTVGWFTAIYPVIVDGAGGTHASILGTKETLRAVPSLGLGFPAATADLPAADITLTFNYLGSQGGQSSTGGQRSWLGASGTPSAEVNEYYRGIKIAAVIVAGQLQVTVSCDRNIAAPSWAAAFAQAFEAQLSALAAHCRDQDTSYRTVSDLGSADISDAELAALNQMFE